MLKTQRMVAANAGALGFRPRTLGATAKTAKAPAVLKPVKINLPKSTLKTTPKALPNYGTPIVNKSSGPVVTDYDAPPPPVVTKTTPVVSLVAKASGKSKLDKVGGALKYIFDRVVPPPAGSSANPVESIAAGEPYPDGGVTGGLGSDVGSTVGGTVGGALDTFSDMVNRHSGALLLIGGLVGGTIILPKLFGGGRRGRGAA